MPDSCAASSPRSARPATTSPEAGNPVDRDTPRRSEGCRRTRAPPPGERSRATARGRHDPRWTARDGPTFRQTTRRRVVGDETTRAAGRGGASFQCLREFKELRHDACGTLPVSCFGGELSFTAARDRVDLHAAPGARCSPLGRNPPMLLKLQECGVERPLVDGELVGADLLDPSGDRVSMQWPHRVERLQNDEIKRAVKDVGLVGWHVLEVYSYDVLSVNRFRPSLLKVGGCCERRFAGRARPMASGRNLCPEFPGPRRERRQPLYFQVGARAEQV